MGYVIAAILVLLIVAAGVTFFVLNATKRQRESPAGIAAPDEETPLGDTNQHAGEQTSEGRTVDQPEEGGRTTAGSTPPAASGGVGGEAEGGSDRPVIPDSEKLADRPR